MGNSYPTPTEDEIVAAVEGTGFLFEQRMARLLGSDVRTGWAFQDQDESVSREIDLYASRSALTYIDGRETHIGWTLLGECKNYKSPWVAITTDYGPDGEEWPHSEVYMSDAVRDKLGGNVDDRMIGSLTHLDRLYSKIRLWPAPRAVQLMTLRKKNPIWETHDGEIYKSVTYPLAKAVTVLTNRLQSSAREIGLVPRVLRMFFPVLVVSTPIFSVSLAADGSPLVKEVEHAILERVIESRTVRGKFRIDVVHQDALHRWRTEYIPTVLGQLTRALGADEDIDPRLTERLTALHIDTLDDVISRDISSQ